MGDMTETMKAISIVEPGGPEMLRLVDRDIPSPGDHEALVKVAAAGVNRPDVLQRQGLYPLPPGASPLPGLEIAGEVVATGAGTRSVRTGDRVMALVHGGGYAQFCTVHESHCLPIPKSLDAVGAAAVPETFFTVYYNVFTRGELREGETLLVHGGSSGIGTTAIQLAKANNASVVVTAGSDEKCEFCLGLGADHAINYRATDWEKAALDATGGVGPNIVLDMVAGPYMQKNIDILARDGRYVIIAFLQGPQATLNMRAVLGKRLTITGSTLRPQSIAEKAAIAADLHANVFPLLEDGIVKPIIYKTFPLAEAARAHALMESSEHMGKIVLETGAVEAEIQA